MATIKLQVRIEGLERVHGNLQREKLVAPSIRKLLIRAGLAIEGKAKGFAPVDTGRLRGSIKTEIAPMQAVIGPTVQYGPYVEFGTRPHWPPLAAMQPWAIRHGFPAGKTGAFLVARAIARHGTRPQPYMRLAAEESKAEIEGFAQDAAREIQERWERSG